MITVTRKHSFAAAHRLYDYDGKCEHLHGHNYQLEVTLTSAELDTLGMVLDFALIKEHLLAELDRRWDHRTLLSAKDPLSQTLPELLHDDSVCVLPCNPTAENMAQYLGEHLFPSLLAQAGYTHVRVFSVILYETENSWARWQAEDA